MTRESHIHIYQIGPVQHNTANNKKARYGLHLQGETKADFSSHNKEYQSADCPYGYPETGHNEQGIDKESVEDAKLTQQDTASGRSASGTGDAGQMMERAMRQQHSELGKKTDADQPEDSDPTVHKTQIQIAFLPWDNLHIFGHAKIPFKNLPSPNTLRQGHLQRPRHHS
jgi:hypothetical protein